MFLNFLPEHSIKQLGLKQYTDIGNKANELALPEHSIKQLGLKPSKTGAN